MGVKVRKVEERWIKRKDGTAEKVELPEPYYAILVDFKGTRKFRKMKSKEEAEAKAREIEEGLKNGTLSPPSPRPPKPVTFKEHAEKWYLARVMVELKFATQRSYREQLDRHILPAFGKKNLQDITRKEVKAFWSSKRREDLSVGTVRALNTILSAVFTDGIEEELITYNPASKPGKHLKKEDDNKDYHTPEEGHAILEAAKVYAPRMYPLFLTAWCTGARQGELIGLEWGDIDWRGKFITIRRTDYYGHVGSPKTVKIRRVDLADGLAAELDSLRKQMAAEALRKGRSLPDRVFTTKKGTPQQRKQCAKDILPVPGEGRCPADQFP